MSEIILHQYAISPFSEKIRKIFAHKKIKWRSVEQPVIMPKPKLVPLTGGYRKIPVMQIGADVYCDTTVIVRKLDELYPAPTLYPPGAEAAANIIAMWADRRLFFSCVTVIFEKMAATIGKDFIEDRSKLMAGANFAEIGLQAPDARHQVRAFLDILDRELKAHPYIVGDSFSLADAACFHCVWFMRAEPTAFSLVQRFPNLMHWFERIEATGQGEVAPMEPDEALKIARDSTPATPIAADPDDPNGLRPGMRISVTPDDYGFDPVVGKLVASGVHDIAIEREDKDLGRIVNHFPKIGFRIGVV